jgi:hypothetical protein
MLTSDDLPKRGRQPYKRGSLVREIKTGKQPLEVEACFWVDSEWVLKTYGCPFLRRASEKWADDSAFVIY